MHVTGANAAAIAGKGLWPETLVALGVMALGAIKLWPLVVRMEEDGRHLIDNPPGEEWRRELPTWCMG